MGMKPASYPLLLLLLLPAFGLCQDSQSDINILKYIDRYKDVAIREMHIYGIPASITLAQGILESGAGQSELARKANNHFGIKCHKEWTGKTYFMDDDAPHECFRVYDDPEDSYRDHSEFLKTRDRYKFLFEMPVTDYASWAQGLKRAGYATNPSYPDLLIRMIQRFGLDRYDDPGYKPPVAVVAPVADSSVSKGTRTFPYFAPGPGGRKIYINNHVQLVYAMKGDDFQRIAADFDVSPSRLAGYNDLNQNANLEDGQVIYLGKKRSKGEAKRHVVKKGQTLWDISQLYAVRLDKLYKRNNMVRGMEPAAGKVLKLR
jgi:LysM repeat protein